MSVGEVAAALGRSKTTVYKLIAAGRLTVSQFDKSPIVHVDSLQRLLAETKVTAPRPIPRSLAKRREQRQADETDVAAASPASPTKTRSRATQPPVKRGKTRATPQA
jgi:hypothetical protein